MHPVVEKSRVQHGDTDGLDAMLDTSLQSRVLVAVRTKYVMLLQRDIPLLDKKHRRQKE